MKFSILFEDKEISVESSNELTVKSLIKELASKLSFPPETLALMNEKTLMEDSTVINKDDSNKKLILFRLIDVGQFKCSDSGEKELQSEERDLEDLIMKVTGAKKKIGNKKLKSKIKTSNFESRFEIMNQLFSRYPIHRNSAMMLQEFENIINRQNGNNRDSINFEEESISSLGSSSVQTNQSGQAQIQNLNNNSSSGSFFNGIRSTLEMRNPFSRTGSNYPSMGMFRRANVQVDLGMIKNLVDMGFSEDQAKRALTITNNNLNAAADLILSNENLDDLMNPFQAQQQQNSSGKK